jgi:hypothetical protein
VDLLEAEPLRAGEDRGARFLDRDGHVGWVLGGYRRSRIVP